MILQRLAEYYDRLAADPRTSDALPKPGYSSQKMSFCVVIDEDGANPQFNSMMEISEQRNGPRFMFVPGESKATGPTVRPSFLWDTSGFLLGINTKDKSATEQDRTRRAFLAFRDKHLALETIINSTAFSAVCNFLRKWTPELARDRLPELESMIGYYGIFSVAGSQRYVHYDEAVLAYWTSLTAAKENASVAQCLVTGRVQPIARLHEPKIRGVRVKKPNKPPPGGGHLLVSFNGAAYESHGKLQGKNAPVSSDIVFKYANALNYLLSPKGPATFLGDMTVTSWAEKPSETANILSAFITGHLNEEMSAAENRTRAKEIQNFLRQLRAGHAGHSALNEADQTGFYVLGLAPTAPTRIAVRLWLQSTVTELQRNLRKHISDISIDGLPDELTIHQMANATARTIRGKIDFDSIIPGLAAELAGALLAGTPYPLRLLTATLRRIALDGQMPPDRAAVIKAYLRRKGDTSMDAYLNKQHPSAAYHSGRLLAVLAFAQEQAQGTVNAGVVRRNLGSVMTTPGLHLGRLQKAAEVGHIPKLEGDMPGFVRDELMEINVHLKDRIPPTLTLADQGTFMLGFYQELRTLDGVGTQVRAHKLYRTSQGEWVRSRGEVTLANLLAKFGCRYLYEARAILNSTERWPDFLIPAAMRSQDVYIEYLGMSSESYNQRWEEKLRAYREFGAPEEGGPNGRLIILDARSLGKTMPESMMRDLLRPVLDGLLQDNITGENE